MENGISATMPFASTRRSGHADTAPAEEDALRPLLSVVWTDPVSGARGFMVVDRLVNGVSAGGLRVGPNISLREVAALAHNMTRKQAAVGVQVGGGKSGLALDPGSPDKASVLRRFLAALKPYIEASYSVGPDMNTTLPELEALARDVGIPSLKIAVARNLGMEDAEFLRRYQLFESRVAGGGTVNELRASTAVAAAVTTLVRRLDPGERAPRVAIQGAGTMGAGTARLLHRRGFDIVAWADVSACLRADQGLDVPRLANGCRRGRLPDVEGVRLGGSSEVLTTPCDVLVLAAVEDAVAPAMAEELRCRGVVVVANLGLRRETEEALAARGVLVIPDLLASAGGSLAVEALYRTDPRTGQDILDHVQRRAEQTMGEVLDAARASRSTVRAVLDRRFTAGS
jgi:glutamate dehydrogenase (NAD(P)+)